MSQNQVIQPALAVRRIQVFESLQLIVKPVSRCAVTRGPGGCIFAAEGE